jgi:hypothetical protein
MQLVDAVYVIMAWATATNLANVSCQDTRLLLTEMSAL